MRGQLSRRRHWLVPEVVQTSAMDCGPAVLKCLLAGFGVRIHYGRLREACQTDLDGTSIDTLEQVASGLGLVAEQMMLPPDHVLLPEAEALPAILIVRLPGGATHFVLVWRRHGPFVQVMDPSLGRRWISCRQLVSEMYSHQQRVPAEAWREWAASDEMLAPLRRRMRNLGLGRSDRLLIDAAVAKPGWRPIAGLDAAVRTLEALVQGGGLPRGAAARRTLISLLEQVSGEEGGESLLPSRFWSVRACSESSMETGVDEPHLWLRGAVLVRVPGRLRSSSKTSPVARPDFTDASGESASPTAMAFDRELQTALQESENRPLSTVWSLVRGAGRISLMFLMLLVVIVAALSVAEAVLWRGVLDLRRDLAIVEQRLVAVGCICLFAGGMMLLEYWTGVGLYSLGRRLETSLRVEFLSKIPRLHDRYFQSRPTSDMAERGHSLHLVRMMPRSAGLFLRAFATIVLTAAAIAWMEPEALPLALTAAAAAILLPLLFLPILQGLDLRVRTHTGALTRFSFDTLLGLAAVRSHVAHAAVSIEHESLLVDWARASYRLLQRHALVDGLQTLTGVCMAAWLLVTHASRAADATGLLLLAYWALTIPVLGSEIVLLVQQYPTYRNIILRLLEPLRAPEQDSPAATEAKEMSAAIDAPPAPATAANGAIAICLHEVHVRAGGHTILDSIGLDVPAGSHLAVVGPSGAGKSSLVGLLLGWHRAAAGEVLVDGRPLDRDGLAELRSKTVWVDPAVQLWNRALLENLLYGNTETSYDQIGDVVQQADLYDVLQRLPDGLQTVLGESGGLLSGGEGQRVKLGRGLARRQPGLVILDEPFRGLERPRRRALLEQARRRWQSATFILITHDVGETLDFPRVLVLAAGQVVEDAAPAALAAASDSLYRSLLDAEDDVRHGLWEARSWRRIQLFSGRVIEDTNQRGATS